MVAYVILAHRLPAQLERLVRRLTVPGVECFVHLDRRSGLAFSREVHARLDDVAGLHWVPSRRVRWGDWTIAAAMLDGLCAVHKTSPAAAQAFVLSGQDYPLKPPAEIAAWLGRRPDVAFLFRDPLPRRQWANERGGLDRVEYRHVWLPRRGMVRVRWPRRRLPAGYHPFGGSQSISLGRRQRQHVVEVARDERRLMRFFRYVANADEIFFQTVLMNSPLRHSIVNDNLRYIRWTGGSSPETLTRADLPDLQRSGALFARKFDDTVDARILDEIDRRLLVRAEAASA